MLRFTNNPAPAEEIVTMGVVCSVIPPGFSPLKTTNLESERAY